MMAALLQVSGLDVAINAKPILEGVSFSLDPGACLGLLGGSGSGKSMTALACLGLLPKGGVASGSILFEGRELIGQDSEAWQRLRGGRISLVFQEPFTSLNPLMSVGKQVAEAVQVHQKLEVRAAWDEAVKGLASVGLPDPEARAKQYPHQFSGGMRQRVMIAMALACKPALLIADEPTTALDVTVQAQILKLLKEKQKEQGFAMIIISHDLGVIAQLANEAVVLHQGRVAESGRLQDLIDAPKSEAARTLLASHRAWAGAAA